jgi:hypothetical protein
MGRRICAQLLSALELIPGNISNDRLYIGDDSAAARYRHRRGERHPFVHLDSAGILAGLRDRQVTVLCGPKIRAWSLVKKHQTAVVERLRIRTDIRAKAEAFVRALRSRYDYLIGVMVRQGDYRTYRNGEFFFASERYALWMRQALSMFTDKGRVGFIVASDDVQDPSVYQGLPYAFSTGIRGSTGHYLESLAELALCDLILTPPSSFGAWGAFSANAGIIPLVGVNQALRREDQLGSFYDCLRHPVMGRVIW